MTYMIECFNDLRVSKENLEDAAAVLAKEYYNEKEYHSESKEEARRIVEGFMLRHGFDWHDEADAIRFSRDRKDVGETSLCLSIMAPFLEGQHISWLGEDGTIWYDAFHDGVMHEEAWDNPDELIGEHMRLKRRYALACD